MIAVFTALSRSNAKMPPVIMPNQTPAPGQCLSSQYDPARVAIIFTAVSRYARTSSGTSSLS